MLHAHDHVPKYLKEFAQKKFGKEVRQHPVGWTIDDVNLLSFRTIFNPEETNIDVP